MPECVEQLSWSTDMLWQQRRCVFKYMEETRASNTVEDDEYALTDRLIGEPAFKR
jgi:hypothetical protein